MKVEMRFLRFPKHVPGRNPHTCLTPVVVTDAQGRFIVPALPQNGTP
jgi:hypothetical protein